jgi:hypothetical protein
VVVAALGVATGLLASNGSSPHRPAASVHSAVSPSVGPPAPSGPASIGPAASGAALITSSAGSSTYHVAASATISLQATGSCWVEIRQTGPSGRVLFEGDLVAGESRSTGGPAWVRLGNPTAMVVSVDGASIAPPGLVAGQPYDLLFA